MSEFSFSDRLRDLSNEYCQSHISFEEYRSMRKVILDKIDEEYNGFKQASEKSDESQNVSIFMKTIAFFKNRDIER